MDIPKGTKLKKKLILKTEEMQIEINNTPCRGYHLKILQRKDDPSRVDFVYFPPEKFQDIVEKLQNKEQVKQYFEILDDRGEEMPCEIEKFVFKTLYSALDKSELFILSKRGDIDKKKSNISAYLKAFDSFLKLKKKQENKIRLFKKRLPAELTFEEKKERVDNFKLSCINCKKKVGNIFINTKDKLKILCGAKKEPCNIGFEIKKPKIINLLTEIDNLKEKLEELKEEIIKSKLDFLFKLKTEDVVTEKFNLLKDEYNNINAELVFYQIQLEDQTNIEERDRQINIENIKLKEMIKAHSNNIKEYESTNNKSFLTDAIEIYIDEIIPILKKKSELLYKIRGVKKIRGKRWLLNAEKEQFESLEGSQSGNFKLVQKRNLYTNFEFVK